MGFRIGSVCGDLKEDQTHTETEMLQSFREEQHIRVGQEEGPEIETPRRVRVETVVCFGTRGTEREVRDLVECDGRSNGR